MPDATRSSRARAAKEGVNARRRRRRSCIPVFVSKLSYSNVIATIALFVALGGVAVAAGLPKNSVGPKQFKSGAVTTPKTP